MKKEEFDHALVVAFIQGAKWWELEKTDFTMWQSDQHKAEKEALRRLEQGTLDLCDKAFRERFSEKLRNFEVNDKGVEI